MDVHVDCLEDALFQNKECPFQYRDDSNSGLFVSCQNWLSCGLGHDIKNRA